MGSTERTRTRLASRVLLRVSGRSIRLTQSVLLCASTEHTHTQTRFWKRKMKLGFQLLLVCFVLLLQVSSQAGRGAKKNPGPPNQPSYDEETTCKLTDDSSG